MQEGDVHERLAGVLIGPDAGNALLVAHAARLEAVDLREPVVVVFGDEQQDAVARLDPDETVAVASDLVYSVF